MNTGDSFLIIGVAAFIAVTGVIIFLFLTKKKEAPKLQNISKIPEPKKLNNAAKKSEIKPNNKVEEKKPKNEAKQPEKKSEKKVEKRPEKKTEKKAEKRDLDIQPIKKVETENKPAVSAQELAKKPAVNSQKNKKPEPVDDDDFVTVVRGKNGKIPLPNAPEAQTRSIDVLVIKSTPSQVPVVPIQKASQVNAPKSVAPVKINDTNKSKAQLKKERREAEEAQKQLAEEQKKLDEEAEKLRKEEEERQLEKNRKEKLEAILNNKKDEKNPNKKKVNLQQKLDLVNEQLQRKQKETARLRDALLEQEKILNKEAKLKEQQLKQIQILTTQTAALESKVAAPAKTVESQEKKPVEKKQEKKPAARLVTQVPKNKVENTLKETGKLKADLANKKQNITKLQAQIKSV